MTVISKQKIFWQGFGAIVFWVLLIQLAWDPVWTDQLK